MHIRCDEKIPNNEKTRAWNNSNSMMLNELVSAWGPNDLHLSLYISPILFRGIENYSFSTSFRPLNRIVVVSFLQWTHFAFTKTNFKM